MPTGERGRATGEPFNLTHELEQLVTEVDPQRDPCRLASRPPGVQPSGDLAEPLHEEALARVVGLPELRIVRKVLGIHLLDIEQQPDEVTPRWRGYEPSAQQIENMSDVGEVQTLVKEGRVRILQGEAAVDQLTCGRALWVVHICRVGAIMDAPRVSAVRAAAIPPVCQNTAGVGAPSASNDLNKVMALAP